MPLDISKLEGAVDHGDKIIARCPACAEDGGDRKGEHLVIFDDGRFGCCIHPGDREHRSRIFKLVGKADGTTAKPKPKKKRLSDWNPAWRTEPESE